MKKRPAKVSAEVQRSATAEKAQSMAVLTKLMRGNNPNLAEDAATREKESLNSDKAASMAQSKRMSSKPRGKGAKGERKGGRVSDKSWEKKGFGKSKGKKR